MASDIEKHIPTEVTHILQRNESHYTDTGTEHMHEICLYSSPVSSVDGYPGNRSVLCDVSAGSGSTRLTSGHNAPICHTVFLRRCVRVLHSSYLIISFCCCNAKFVPIFLFDFWQSEQKVFDIIVVLHCCFKYLTFHISTYSVILIYC